MNERVECWWCSLFLKTDESASILSTVRVKLEQVLLERKIDYIIDRARNPRAFRMGWSERPANVIFAFGTHHYCPIETGKK